MNGIVFLSLTFPPIFIIFEKNLECIFIFNMSDGKFLLILDLNLHDEN